MPLITNIIDWGEAKAYQNLSGVRDSMMIIAILLIGMTKDDATEILQSINYYLSNQPDSPPSLVHVGKSSQ